MTPTPPIPVKAAPVVEEPRQRGDWMLTFTGRQFWPMDPDPQDFDVRDIAHALSLLCRYNGHTRWFYSVAEHCLHLSHAVAPEHALWALLHDATEAYVGDMIRPLKGHIPDYVEAEDRVMAVIARRFGLAGEMPEEVKDADTRILLNERAALLTPSSIEWTGTVGLEPLPHVTIRGMNPRDAERAYIARLAQLGVA